MHKDYKMLNHAPVNHYKMHARKCVLSNHYKMYVHINICINIHNMYNGALMTEPIILCTYTSLMRVYTSACAQMRTLESL